MTRYRHGVSYDIDQLAKLASAGGNATSTLKKMSYAVDAAAAVSLYMMYRTFSDELKTGHDSAAEVGSFTSALGSGDQCVKSLEGSCPSQPVNGMAECRANATICIFDRRPIFFIVQRPSNTADLSLLGTAYAAGADGAARSLAAVLIFAMTGTQSQPAVLSARKNILASQTNMSVTSAIFSAIRPCGFW